MLTLLTRPSHPSWGTAGTVPKGQQGREPSSSLESPTLWVRRWNIPSLNHYPVDFSTCSCSSQLSTLTQRLLTVFPQAQGLLQPSLAPASASHNKSRCWLSLWAHPGWGYGSASHTGAEQQVRAAPPPSPPKTLRGSFSHQALGSFISTPFLYRCASSAALGLSFPSAISREARSVTWSRPRHAADPKRLTAKLEGSPLMRGRRR